MRPVHLTLGKRGFTLVEMLLVIVLIGVLAGLLVPGLVGRAKEARVARAKADLTGNLSLALDLYEQDIGAYPTTEQGLAALVANPGVEGWKGPYLKTGLKPDPWGTPYQYTLLPDGHYALLSAGPDRQTGSEDDIAP